MSTEFTLPFGDVNSKDDLTDNVSNEMINEEEI